MISGKTTFAFSYFPWLKMNWCHKVWHWIKESQSHSQSDGRTHDCNQGLCWGSFFWFILCSFPPANGHLQFSNQQEIFSVKIHLLHYRVFNSQNDTFADVFNHWGFNNTNLLKCLHPVQFLLLLGASPWVKQLSKMWYLKPLLCTHQKEFTFCLLLRFFLKCYSFIFWYIWHSLTNLLSHDISAFYGGVNS